MSYRDFEVDEEMEEACRRGDLLDRGEDPDAEFEDPRSYDGEMPDEDMP